MHVVLIEIEFLSNLVVREVNPTASFNSLSNVLVLKGVLIARSCLT